jgi:glycosyltransferase involved in cell wall biosynthesis
MRVLAIVPNLYDSSPGQRFRIEQWEPFLRERGVEITYAPFATEQLAGLLYQPGNTFKKLAGVTEGFSRRFKSVRSAREFDLVYLFREAALFGPPVFERMMASLKVPFVFDFDDAIFVSYRSPSNGYLSYLKFAGKAGTICRLAAHVMVGNPYLAEYSRRYNPNVTVIPTTIDLAKYELREPVTDDVVTIGWTGSFSTVQHLDTLRSALQKLAKRERFRLRVIGTPRYELEGIEVEAMNWRADTEVEDLRPCDIGIMPLPDDKWSKGKCGLKALQFMALGTPTICSPVGVNTEIIQDGLNGFIAGDDDEWVEKLGALVRSAELRRRIGLAGRATVEQTYSNNVQSPRVFDIFHSVVSQKSQPARVAQAKSTAAVRQATESKGLD